MNMRVHIRIPHIRGGFSVLVFYGKCHFIKGNRHTTYKYKLAAFSLFETNFGNIQTWQQFNWPLGGGHTAKQDKANYKRSILSSMFHATNMG